MEGVERGYKVLEARTERLLQNHICIPGGAIFVTYWPAFRCDLADFASEIDSATVIVCGGRALIHADTLSSEVLPAPAGHASSVGSTRNLRSEPGWPRTHDINSKIIRNHAYGLRSDARLGT